MHHVQLAQKTPGQTYSIAVFSLADLDIVSTNAGHEVAQEAIRHMGLYIDKHFGAIGGFSTRRHTNEFVTVLPYSDQTEAQSILNNFIKDFQERGLQDVWAGGRRQTASGKSAEFRILAGIAQGQPAANIDSVINAAKTQQKEIARLRCDVRR
jgi:phospholipid/cholesterol/gamma-HCH transport system ATP-binding protein